MTGDGRTKLLVAAIPLPAPDAAGDRLSAMSAALERVVPTMAADPDIPRLALFPAGTGVADGAAASFLDSAATVARTHGIWLCPGTWVDERNRHVTGLFAPDGALVATQAQTHLAPGETYTPDTDLTLADTPFGPVGFLVGRDASVPEVGRILARRGATLLLALVTGREPYSKWDQIAGTWAQVQQNQVFAAEAGLVGPGYSGRPAVMAPCEMTDGLTGYLAGYADDSADPPAAGPAMAVLDDDARLAVKKQYDILGLQNPALYERYLPRLYRSPAPGSGYAGGGQA